MSVEFDEEKKLSYREFFPEKPGTGSKMGDWLLSSGIAKDAKTAHIILVSATALIFASSIYFFVYGFHLPHSSVPVRSDVQLPPGLRRATLTSGR
jgi:hypothetical protein